MHEEDSEQESELDISSPLPGEIPTGSRVKFMAVAAAILLLGLGFVLGVAFSPRSQSDTEQALKNATETLEKTRRRISELERSLTYSSTAHSDQKGILNSEDRARMQQQGALYAQALRKEQAQSAAELVEWFTERWIAFLDFPETNDRVTRRAETLMRLIGGMSAHLNPKDYVPWQAEFLGGHWLGELHFDLDQDGYPATRKSKNPRDGFTNVSVCQVAMALNQLATDGRIMVMPNMHCERPDSRVSVFLQGGTVDDAFDEFVRACKRAGFVVVDKPGAQMRLILVSNKRD
jgi:hypothetical protein